MVNNPIPQCNNPRIVVSRDCIIRRSGDREWINNGPVYDLAIAQQLLKLNGLAVVNDSARYDMANSFNPELTETQLKLLILALKSDVHYIESERCATSNRMTIDSDAYSIRWNRKRAMECNSSQKIYVKFGFRENINRCLVVRIHISKYQ